MSQTCSSFKVSAVLIDSCLHRCKSGDLLLSKPSPALLLFRDTQLYSRALLALPADPCLIVMPPCMGEADRFSLDALRHIHKQLDDDNDGGIEVNESVEVSSDILFIM